jgi:hypothetical protein
MLRNSCIRWKSVRIDRVSTEIGHEREWAGAAGRIRSILKQLMRFDTYFRVRCSRLQLASVGIAQS